MGLSTSSTPSQTTGILTMTSCQMGGNGNTVWTHYLHRMMMVQQATQMVMASRICRSIITVNLLIGTFHRPHRYWITVFGGMEPFPSTTGMKKMPCNTTSQVVVILGLMEQEALFYVMKTLQAIFVLTDLTMTRTAWSILMTTISTVMLIVHLTMMTETVLLMKTRTVGTLMVMECLMAGKHPMDSTQHLHQTQMVQMVTLMVTD